MAVGTSRADAGSGPLGSGPLGSGQSGNVTTKPVGPLGSAADKLYHGGEGMWSWVAHRISGVLIFFFLFAHVLDTALVRVSPEAYNSVIGTYKNPVVGLGEAGLVAAVIFHALNGIRIILVDFWSKGARLQAKMFWAVVVLWVLLFAPFAVRHLTNVFH